MKSEMEVPEGWEVTKLGELFVLEYGKGLTKKDRDNGTFPVYGSNGIVGHHSKCLFKGPSIIVGRKGTIGAIAWSDLDAWAIDTTYYIQLKKKELDMKWLFYKLNSLNLSKLNMATGIPGLNRGSVYSKSIALPSFPEQQKIADILSKVDEQIDFTETIIDKTEELKKGLMQKLLTKGICNKYFKDIQLYGKEYHIPKSWNVINFQKYTTFISNGFVGTATPFYTSSIDGISYLMSKNIRKNEIDEREITKITLDFHRQNKKTVLEEGDLLTVQSGHIGTSCVVPKKYVNCNCHALIISRFDPEQIDTNYLSQFLNSNIGSNIVRNIFVGSTILHINTKDLKKLKIFIPPIKEQKQIASILSKVDEQIQDNKKELKHLQELKKGLMHDLLTGKVRVSV